MARDSDILDAYMARVLRGMTGAERLKIANDMFLSVRRMFGRHLAAEHPDWDQERIERETARSISHEVVDHAYIESAEREVWQEILRRS